LNSEERENGEIDYTKLRENTENARRLQEYYNQVIMIKTKVAINKMKPAFERQGWTYGGTHYGKGLGLSVVVDCADDVVPKGEVHALLSELGIGYWIATDTLRLSAFLEFPGDTTSKGELE